MEKNGDFPRLGDMGDIYIADLDLAEVLTSLYNRAKPQGSGMLHYIPTDMTVEQANEILKTGQRSFDYLNGRVLKVNLNSDYLNPKSYDRDNGKGAALAAIRKVVLGEVVHSNNKTQGHGQTQDYSKHNIPENRKSVEYQIGLSAKASAQSSEIVLYGGKDLAVLVLNTMDKIDEDNVEEVLEENFWIEIPGISKAAGRLKSALLELNKQEVELPKEIRESINNSAWLNSEVACLLGYGLESGYIAPEPPSL